MNKSTINMSREEWLEARKHGIGGSDAASAAGISKYKSRVSLWLEKTGQVEQEEPGEAAYWGNVLEDIVAKEFEIRTGMKVRRKNSILVHPKHSFMLANIDREIIGRKSGLECKTSGSWAKDSWEGDEIPDAYYLQCMHYMAVTGCDSWHIACLIGGQKFVYKEIIRNEAMIDQLIKIESEFWQHVVNGTMPEVDGSEECTEALKSLYKDCTEIRAELPLTAELLVNQYKQSCDDIKTAEKLKLEAQNALCALLGDHSSGTVKNYVVNWSPVKARETFDAKSFAVDYPELAKKYVKIGESTRRFSVKEIK